MNEKSSVLYIDDEPANLTSFKYLFSDEFEIYVTENGEEGLRIVGDNDLDLVISDQRMPGLTGVEVLEKIYKRWPNTARMILTGYSDYDAVVDAINQGHVYCYVEKPWDEKQFRQTMRNAIASIALERRNARLLAETRAANKELLAARENLSSMMTHMPDGIALVGSGGTIEFSNPALADLFGYEPHELDGDSMNRLVPGRVVHQAKIDQFFSDPRARRFLNVDDLAGRRKDGTEFAVDIMLNPIELGGEIKCIAAVRDMSIVREAENKIHGLNKELAQRVAERTAELELIQESLKHQNSLIDLLRQTASDANEASDFGQGVGVCLQSITAFTGWPVGHVYLVSSEDDDLLVPSRIWNVADKKRFSAIIDVTEKTTFKRGVGLPGRVFESGQPSWIKDVTVDPNFPRAKMADDIGVKGAFAFPVLAGSKVVAVLEFFDDEPSEPNQDLLKTVTHIGSQLGRLYEREKAAESLRDARDAADGATKAKSAFLATMSHEIRTPMNGVIGLIDLVRESQLEASQSEMVEAARDSTYALLRIVDDILDFSKIEAGKLEIMETECSITDIVEGVGQTLAGAAELKAVKLNTYVDPRLPGLIVADELRLRQILLNLAGNAIKFSGSDDSRQGRVEIGVEHLDGGENGMIGVRYYVRDNGIGIPDELKASLFLPFHQLEVSTTRRFGGTGLGLAICSSLVEMMDGEIGAESKVGHGATFNVVLQHQAVTQPSADDSGSLEGLKGLVVTPDPDLTRILEKYLGYYGCKITSNEKLERALPVLQKAAKKGAPYEFILIAAAEHLAAAADLAANCKNDRLTDDLRFVIVEPRSHVSGTRDNKNVISLQGEPIHRGKLIQAIAVATGRASPIVEDDQRPDDHVPATVGPPSREEAMASGRLILVAEDNLTNQFVIRRQLTHLGYAADIVDDGQQALDAISKSSYGLVLADCHMPNLDGFEFAEAVRKGEKGDAHIPIIAFTANAIKSELERCRSSGMDDVLVKPVALTKLADVLAEWLP